MSDADRLLAAWRTTYGEHHPGRDPELMRYEDSTLALGVTLERRFREFLQVQSAKPAPLANLRTRTLDRLSKHKPSDPE